MEPADLLKSIAQALECGGDLARYSEAGKSGLMLFSTQSQFFNSILLQSASPSS
jgi:hypothetical protein